MNTPKKKQNKIPGPTVSRLPIYSRCLIELEESGQKMVSSEEIARMTGIKASQFRKDLSYFGGFGVQGYGYNAKQLLEKISAIMNLHKKNNVILIGLGNLGSALAHYPGFVKWNFNICEVYDKNPKKVGKKVNGLKVKNIKNFPKKCRYPLAIIAVPGKDAQTVHDLLVKSGIKAVLNFSGKKLLSKNSEIIRNVDLTNELAILSYHLAID
ncbi:MAG: redox-sensing transcriptional repressor Rex [Armatimonadota bacterium]